MQCGKLFTAHCCEHFSLVTQVTPDPVRNPASFSPTFQDKQVYPLRKSLFPIVPPTLRFFSLTEDRNIVPLPVGVRNHLKWKLTNITPTLVRDIVRRSGFKMTRGENIRLRRQTVLCELIFFAQKSNDITTSRNYRAQ